MASLTPRLTSTRNHQIPTMTELDNLRISFYAATTLCEDILNRFSISSSMDLEEYNDCKNDLKLATDTYPSVNNALSSLQVKNKGTLDSTELDSMKVTKAELNSRIKNCTKGLGLWRKSNPGNDPPGTTIPTAQAGDSSHRDTQTGIEKRMAAITNYEKCGILHKDLLAEIKEVPDYNDTDDHTITKGMKKKADWAKRMRELRLDIVETKNKITACNVSDHVALIDTLELDTIAANELLAKTIKDIEAADVARGIFSDRAVKSCPKKLPSFAGLKSEDFSFFKDQFIEAAKYNRVPLGQIKLIN